MGVLVVVRDQRVGDAEVGHADTTVVADQYVRRLEVAVLDPGVVSSGEITELANQFQHSGAHRSPIDKTGAIAHVDAVGRGVLRNDQQLTNAGLQQCACFS